MNYSLSDRRISKLFVYPYMVPKSFDNREFTVVEIYNIFF